MTWFENGLSAVGFALALACGCVAPARAADSTHTFAWAASAPLPEGAFHTGIASRQALTRAAFPHCRLGEACLIEVQTEQSHRELRRVTVAIRSQDVVAVDDAYRVLVFTGRLQAPDGTATHLGGIVGAIGFERRDRAWRAVAWWPAIDWTAGIGEPDVEQIALGRGHPGLVVSSGSCGPTGCSESTDVLELGRSGGRLVLAGLKTHADSLAETGGCEAFVQRAVTGAVERSQFPSGCFDITGAIAAVPAPGREWADLSVRYAGLEFPLNPGLGLPFPIGRSALMAHVDDELVLRYGAEHYEVLSGNNRAEAP
jgi:hypothetical protein